MANIPRVGIAKQVSFGTANTTFTAVKLTDIGTSELTVNRIENDELFGGIDSNAPMVGTQEAAVSVSGIAYPSALGYFLNMIAGAPTTTGSSPDYTHVFKPSDTLAPAYTVGFDEDSGIDTYFRDFRASSLTIEQAVNDVARFSLDGIASTRVATSVTVGTSGVETAPFTFTQFGATLTIGSGDPTVYTNFKDVSVTIDNPVSNIFVLNGQTTAVTQEFTGRRGVSFDANLRFDSDSNSLRAPFESNAQVSLELEWEINADVSLLIKLPNLRIEAHDWTRGYDETTLPISGNAYYDVTDASSVVITLKNGTASY